MFISVGDVSWSKSDDFSAFAYGYGAQVCVHDQTVEVYRPRWFPGEPYGCRALETQIGLEVLRAISRTRLWNGSLRISSSVDFLATMDLTESHSAPSCNDAVPTIPPEGWKQQSPTHAIPPTCTPFSVPPFVTRPHWGTGARKFARCFTKTVSAIEDCLLSMRILLPRTSTREKNLTIFTFFCHGIVLCAKVWTVIQCPGHDAKLHPTEWNYYTE